MTDSQLQEARDPRFYNAIRSATKRAWNFVSAILVALLVLPVFLFSLMQRLGGRDRLGLKSSRGNNSYWLCLKTGDALHRRHKFPW